MTDGWNLYWSSDHTYSAAVIFDAGAGNWADTMVAHSSDPELDTYYLLVGIRRGATSQIYVNGNLDDEFENLKSHVDAGNEFFIHNDFKTEAYNYFNIQNQDDWDAFDRFFNRFDIFWSEEIDGFTPGEKMAIKFWDASADTEYDIKMHIETGSELLGESALTKVSLLVLWIVFSSC